MMSSAMTSVESATICILGTIDPFFDGYLQFVGQMMARAAINITLPCQEVEVARV
jgi:hypothetical protein